MPEPPSFLFVHVNKSCNLRCQHCHYWLQNDDDKQKYLSWERKAQILGEFAGLSPDGAVVICGGESMLDPPNYFAITRHCLRLGLRSLSVINGTRVHSPEIADQMIVEGPSEISVSLDSHNEETHDRLRGVRGSFRAATRALRLLLDARQRHPQRRTRIYVMGLVCAQNYLSLDAFYDFVLNRVKADKLKLNFLQPSFGGKDAADVFFVNNSILEPDTLVEAIRQCNRKYSLNLNPQWLQQVGMYFRSVNASSDLQLGWRSSSGTVEPLCNSYDRNIVVDLYGVARLCFSWRFAGYPLNVPGDLRRFWDSSDSIRAQMRECRAFCGISHSVRRESSTLTPRRPKREYFGTTVETDRT